MKHGSGDVPVLGYVSSGSQSHVFGTSRWVIAVPRFSLRRLLSAFVSTRRWLEEVQKKLHGVAAPFDIVPEYRFQARLPGGKAREFRGTRAIVKPRFEPTQFLDYRIEHGTPEQLYQYVAELVALLEKLHVRGFHMLDFIRRNFVFVGERLYISDPGMIVPLRYLKEPTMGFSAMGFGHGLTRDYRNVLSEALEKSECEDLKNRIRKLKSELPARIRALRKWRGVSPNEEDWMSVEFPADLKAEIRRTVQ